MTWVRIDDGAPLHPKLLDAGPEAAWLWTCGLAYCNRNHTDGLIAARHLAALYPGAWPAVRLEELAARLVSVRLWDADGPDYRVHDYAHYQEEATREVVDARRVYERERKRAQRLKARPGHVPDNVPGTIAGHVPGTTTGTPPGTEGGTAPADMPAAAPPAPTHAPVVPAPRPVPSRPDPGSEIQKSEPVAFALRAPPTEAGQGDAAELERLRAEKAKDDERKARNRAKAKAREENPPPFDIGAAFEAIASAAKGRFAPGTAREWTPGRRIAVSLLIRTYPTLAEWECLGRWLAAGGEAYRGVLGPAWAASSACTNAMALARDWHAKGEGPAGDPTKSGVHSVPMPPVVRKGDLAVDAPVMPAAQARPYVANLMAQFRAGVPITPDGATGNG